MQTILRAEYNGWNNPGDVNWVKPKIVFSRRWSQGFIWICYNHPEMKCGHIRGISRSNGAANRFQAYARLSLHMVRYHGLILNESCLEILVKQANRYTYVGWRR